MARKSKKDRIIGKIKTIIQEWGSFSVGEIQADASPCVNSIGNNIIQLAERFDLECVTAVTYEHDREIDENTIYYENLSVDVLEEIFLLAEEYEADCLRTEKRCSN